MYMDEKVLLTIAKNMAIAHFNLDGEIIDVNTKFLHIMGYKKKELLGKYHCVFVDETYRKGIGYKEFWNSLCQGNTISSEFRRFRSDNKEIWLQAIYYPVKSSEGQVVSIIKIATEISTIKEKYYDNYILLKKIDAVNHTVPIIEFSTDGTVIDVNHCYLKLFGYELHEVINKHHRMFVPESERHSKEYHDFWDQLIASQIFSGNIERVGKNGEKVLMSGLYYPLIDERGRCKSILKIAMLRNEKNKIVDTKHEELVDTKNEVL